MNASLSLWHQRAASHKSWNFIQLHIIDFIEVLFVNFSHYIYLRDTWWEKTPSPIKWEGFIHSLNKPKIKALTSSLCPSTLSKPMVIVSVSRGAAQVTQSIMRNNPQVRLPWNVIAPKTEVTDAANPRGYTPLLSLAQGGTIDYPGSKGGG